MSVAMVGAGISAFSAISGARASKKAANVQQESAREANALSREQFEQTRADNAPFRERGNQAGNRLQYLMGLDGGAGGSGGPTAQLDRNTLRNQLLSKYTKTSAAAAAPTYLGGSTWALPDGRILSSGGLEAIGYKQDSNRPIYGGESGNQILGYEMTGPQTSSQTDEAGLNAEIERQIAAQQAAQQAAQSDPEFGSLMRNFSAADRDADPLYAQLRPQIDQALERSSSFEKSPLYSTVNKALERANSNFETAPGYQFRLAEGMKGVENSGAARGMQLSGAALKAINRFNQDFASNEYGNWFNQTNIDRNFASGEYGNWFNQSNTDRNFVAGQGDAAYNRFNNNNTSKYNRLAGIAGTGQQATRDVNSAGAAYAQNAGSNIMGAGNAQAAGIVGGANALNQGISQGYNMYQNNQLMDLIRRPQTSPGWGNGGGWSGGGRVVPNYPGAEY